MATKRKQRRRGRPNWHLTSREFQAFAFVTTLVLAGVAIILQINEPVVWRFLTTAIGIAVGQAIQSNRNR
jgi:hypothetical protein